jgi:hypothetical protein
MAERKSKSSINGRKFNKKKKGSSTPKIEKPSCLRPFKTGF